MRTFVATYRIDTDYMMDKFFNIINTKNIKYKFVEDNGKTICYLTIIANNRLHLRKLKKEGLKTIKKLGKVELIIGVG